MKVAEAKVIENSQRDLNIAFVNELSVIFERLDIDTVEVLSCWIEMEFSTISSWYGWWPLHRGRSLLFDS